MLPTHSVAPRRVELVLLHEAGQAPSGTAAWLAARPRLARHHHIRTSNPQDMARLSRWAAGAWGGCTKERLVPSLCFLVLCSGKMEVG
jgi:hypothetical protein